MNKELMRRTRKAFAMLLTVVLLSSAACSTAATESTPDDTTPANVASSDDVASDAEEGAEEITSTSSIKLVSQITQASDVEAEDLYMFEYNNVRFAPKDSAPVVRGNLGEYSSLYQAPSCVFEGQDNVYAYDGFELNTADYNGEEVVVGMFITGADFKTPSGLHIGSTYDEVVELYGEPDLEEIGQFTWISEDCDVVIVFIDDVAVSISYIGNFPGY